MARALVITTSIALGNKLSSFDKLIVGAYCRNHFQYEMVMVRLVLVAEVRDIRDRCQRSPYIRSGTAQDKLTDCDDNMPRAANELRERSAKYCEGST